MQYVKDQGGSRLDIYRLLKDGVGQHDWPNNDWWWGVLEDFVADAGAGAGAADAADAVGDVAGVPNAAAGTVRAAEGRTQPPRK